MPRPKICRRINGQPEVRYFKPRGIPMRDLTEVYLPLEGFEALRLSDMDGLNQGEAALRMGVSRQTFGRILGEARKSVSEAIVRGCALRIEGGDFILARETLASSAAEVSKTGRCLENSGSPPTIKKGAEAMKTIAVSSEGPSMDDPVDPRFGRAAGFLIVDLETQAVRYIDNGASQTRAQGAGIQAAETVVRSGAKVVLTGFVGPKAFDALAAAGVQVAQNLDGLTVREAVQRFKDNQVVLSTAPNSPGGRR